MSTLKGLNPAARVLVADEAFRTGEVPAVEAGQYVVEDLGLGRSVRSPRCGRWWLRRCADSTRRSPTPGLDHGSMPRSG